VQRPEHSGIECPDAVYHVMARGNRGQAIFQHDISRPTLMIFIFTVSDGLEMGHYTRVTKTISRMSRAYGGQVATLGWRTQSVGIERALSDGFILERVSKIVAADVRRRKGVRFPPEIRLLTSAATELGESPNTLLGVDLSLFCHRRAPRNQRHSFRSWMQLAELHEHGG
jgi:hypothetical protein